MRLQFVEIIATLLAAVLMVASTPVSDSDDGGQSVTVGASWLETPRNDVVEEVVHSLDDYDELTTSASTTPNYDEQLSTKTTDQTPRTPNIADEKTQPSVIQSSTSSVATSSTTSPTTSSGTPEVSVPSSLSTTQSTRPRAASTTTENVSFFRRVNSSGSDGVFTYRSTSNSSSEEEQQTPSDANDYYYTDTGETITTEDDIQRTGSLANSNETDDVDHIQNAEYDDVLPQQLPMTDVALFNVSEIEQNSSNSAAAGNGSSVANQPESEEMWISSLSSTSTSSPLSTAWLLAELPSVSDDWTNEVHSPDEYVAGPRKSSSHAVMSTFQARFGPHWRLLQRHLRPARRRSRYRQILASPFVAGGRSMSERERKRALLQAYLLSGITGKDLSHRRAISAAVLYRSKLAKLPATPPTVDELPQQTDAELSTLNVATDVTANPQNSELANVTDSWPDNSSSMWNANSSTLLTGDWTSDNATANLTTDDDGLISALHHSSSHRAAAAAVVVPIIVGFLESLTKKQFSWLDLTLAVCGTVAAVLGLINLVVFVIHLLRNKRGKLSFHADRQLTNRHASSSSPSTMSASRSSSDSTPPPPPPPPPLPLTGLGGLSRSSREVSRDVLADDETLRIRPLTFKRPLTDWGFTSIHGTTDAAVVAGQNGGVSVKLSGSDASSSGIESNGGRSDGGSTRRVLENGGNMAVGSSVITNYAYCGNGTVNKGIIIDVDEPRDHSCTSPSDFVFGNNYGELDTKRKTLTMLRPMTPTDDMLDRKPRERSHKKHAKHRARTKAHVGRPDGGLLSRPWKRIFGVSTDVSLPR